MADRIIRKTLEGDVRIMPLDLQIESIVPEEIRQQRRDHRPLGRPLLPWLYSAVLSIEQHPAAVGVFPHRPHQQRVVNAIKVAPDIEVEDPVVPPTPLPRHSHGLER
jgi:hypothetical protein